MIGKLIKDLLTDRKTNVSELSRATQIPSTTIYSIIKRNNTTIDLEDLLKICRVLEVSPDYFFSAISSEDKTSLSSEEWQLLSRWRELDEHGKKLCELVISAELERLSENSLKSEPEKKTKIVPLFYTPAAAGYMSPAFGEEYDDYEIPAESRADFAVKITGDSMEPYIADNSIVLVERDLRGIRDGDVGIFCVDNDMFCKQYCEDPRGTVYLFSLNRDRSDADIAISKDSDSSVFCYGRVLLEKRPPLPNF
ncbi:helix-turn-helix domain-containing protein [Clostridiaceae bacterium OttesenSCG-928-D20]|nr:helix-turn-helix domain-containing protein [Clostridiaceae bacterium OttesenSCG-928-D20]